MPCLAIQLGRTKTGDADEAGRVLLVGPPVEALREWLERADISKGPIFRAIDRWEAIEERALTPQSINLIVKRRCAMAGFEPREFSAHGLAIRLSDGGGPPGSSCPKPCSNPSIARSSRQPVITTRPSDDSVKLHGSASEQPRPEAERKFG